MYQLLLVGSLVAVLLVLVAIRMRKTTKRRQRWMPDIRKVV